MMESRATRPKSPPPPAAELTAKDTRVLVEITRYTDATGEPCGGRYLARRLGLHVKTVQEHLERLHRKGWLRGPGSPAVPAHVVDRTKNP